MGKLKPCPFCGGKAKVDRMGTIRVSMQISCEDCGADVETGETWIDENSQWNTRASGWITNDCWYPKSLGIYRVKTVRGECIAEHDNGVFEVAFAGGSFIDISEITHYIDISDK